MISIITHTGVFITVPVQLATWQWLEWGCSATVCIHSVLHPETTLAQQRKDVSVIKATTIIGAIGGRGSSVRDRRGTATEVIGEARATAAAVPSVDVHAGRIRGICQRGVEGVHHVPARGGVAVELVAVVARECFRERVQRDDPQEH